MIEFEYKKQWHGEMGIRRDLLPGVYIYTTNHTMRRTCGYVFSQAEDKTLAFDMVPGTGEQAHKRVVQMVYAQWQALQPEVVLCGN